VEPLTRWLPPPDPHSLCPLSSTEFVEPPEKNSWVRHLPPRFTNGPNKQNLHPLREDEPSSLVRGWLYGFRKTHRKVFMRSHVAKSAARTHIICNVDKTELTSVRTGSSKILDKRGKHRPRPTNSAACGGLRVCRRNFLQSLHRMMSRPRKSLLTKSQ
jgi:hypothetical protein